MTMPLEFVDGQPTRFAIMVTANQLHRVYTELSEVMYELTKVKSQYEYNEMKITLGVDYSGCKNETERETRKIQARFQDAEFHRLWDRLEELQAREQLLKNEIRALEALRQGLEWEPE